MGTREMRDADKDAIKLLIATSVYLAVTTVVVLGLFLTHPV